MTGTPGTGRPAWLSDAMFPFESRFFHAPGGHRMHYIDEGTGAPVVFVHGNPSWSFEFRRLVVGLRGEFRCVAPDHVGFGLSSRSDRRDDHHPRAHAERFEALLDHLDLRDATLFLTDWGGPIGLDVARRRPERVARLVIANTWCWPVSRDPHFVMFSLLMRSPLGQLLIRRSNGFVNRVMPRAVGDRASLTAEALSHYRRAQPDPAARAASAALPGHIVGASGWLDSIWRERAAFSEKPALILWGLRDIAFRRTELERWAAALRRADVHEFDDCGHFLAEEAPERILPVMREFLRRA